MRAGLVIPAVVISSAAGLGGAAARNQEQRPTIRSGVELLVVDVQVIDRAGKPLVALKPADFEVSLDGKRRRVVSAELVDFRAGAGAGAPAPPSPVPARAAPASSRAVGEGRRFVVAVDEHSFAMPSARAAMEAAGRFIDRLDTSDLVGLYTYPTGAAHSDLTSDHASVRHALDKVAGLLQPPLSQYRLTKSEIVDIASGDTEVLARVAVRECGPPGMMCRRPILMEATSLAGYLESQIAQSLSGLRNLINGLSKLEGRKTVVLVSGGLFAADRANGRLNMGSEIRELGREAALSNITLYVLHLDSNFIDAFSQGRVNLTSLFRDTNALAAGLEQVAGAAGGAVIRVQAGTGDSAFDRVLTENSAYYLLGVEVEREDRDGEAHQIRVRVRQRGATVRSRNVAVVPKGS
jgi:VWFA-related protein